MKRYIRAMSMEKKNAIKELNSFASILMEHTIKLLVYSDIRPNDIPGWMNTLANWIHRADNITVKPSAKKLSPEDLESSLFGYMGDELNDYKLALYSFQADNLAGRFNHDGKESYPDFEVDDDLAEDLMHICYDIMDATIPLLCDKQNHSKSEYEAAIQSVFSNLI